MSEAAPFAPPQRPGSTTPPPLDLWIRTVLVLLVSLFALLGFAAYVRAPRPAEADHAMFARRLAALDAQYAQLAKGGDKPLRVVFLGTSRFRNVALDNAALARAAKIAGVNRPVASAVIGLNWGGYSRLAPDQGMVLKARPDAVVVMPELLELEYTRTSRARFAINWAKSLLWGQTFAIYGADETDRIACSGFDEGAKARQDKFDSFAGRMPQAEGPVAARGFLKQLAKAGIPVLISDAAVTPELAALQPKQPSPEAFLARQGLAGEANIRARPVMQPLPRSAYCDWAHLDPAKADVWRIAFFKAVAKDLNSLN